MENIILIKLGGSVITDKTRPFCAKERTIRRLGREIADAQKKYKGKLLIGHGSGSFGHTVASRYKTHKGLINRDSLKGAVLTSEAAIEINRIVMRNLVKIGLKVKSFAPASFIVAKGGKSQKVFSEPIRETLSTGVTPVIYGDVIGDTKMGFCIFSAEKVMQVLMKDLGKDYKIKKIVFCSDTDGVYDSKGKTVPEITSKNIVELKKGIGETRGADVTGGMLHKVTQSLELSREYGVKTLIINGNKKDYLKEAILRKRVVGTVIQ